MKNQTNISYFDVLKYFAPKYKNIKCPYYSRQFVNEKGINIVGLVEYKPYNISAVREFNKFLQ